MLLLSMMMRGYTDTPNVTPVYEDEAPEFETWHLRTTVCEVCAAILKQKMY